MVDLGEVVNQHIQLLDIKDIEVLVDVEHFDLVELHRFLQTCQDQSHDPAVNILGFQVLSVENKGYFEGVVPQAKNE